MGYRGRFSILTLALALPLTFADAGWAAELHRDGLKRSSLTAGNRLERIDAPSGLRSKQNGETDARQAEADRLLDLGTEQYNRSEWLTALDTWQEALGIYQSIGDLAGKVSTFNNIGIVNQLLERYSEALDYYNESLAITLEIGDRENEARTLNNIGNVYRLQGNYPDALRYYEESLVLARDLGNRTVEADALSNIGDVNQSLENYEVALESYEQRLVITRELSDYSGEIDVLNNIGEVNQLLENHEIALDYFGQSLVLQQAFGTCTNKARTLTNIGNVFKVQNEPLLTIIFLKLAINTDECIHTNNILLGNTIQQSYSTTTESSYRNLVNLLLSQDRLIEAQKALELLEFKEISDYTRNFNDTRKMKAGIEYFNLEIAIIDNYFELIDQAARNSYQLRRLQEQEFLTSTENQYYERLLDDEQEIRSDLNDFSNSNVAKEGLAALQDYFLLQENIFFTYPDLAELQDSLLSLKKNSKTPVVINPLVFNDRLEIMLITSDSIIRESVPVDHKELNRTISNLRYALEAPGRDVKTPAQQLYDWLIRPIEKELQYFQTDTILYSPDLWLRYVPLGVLHDGDSWLTEAYRINNITTISLDNIEFVPAQDDITVLAAAFSQGNYTVDISGQTIAYNGLPFTGDEVEALAEAVPSTKLYLNEDFSPGIISEMNKHHIVHLATHAAFNPGPLENSYILFGNGESITLSDVKNWNLPNVELFVLSACETALGEVLQLEAVEDTSNNNITGEEILGFGYLMELAGAKAAMGSLWKVDDGGTQVLMSAFYDALIRGGLSKAEALQQAQRDLIRLADSSNRGSLVNVIANSELDLDPDDLSHPHYWAPFILIGNGL